MLCLTLCHVEGSLVQLRGEVWALEDVKEGLLKLEAEVHLGLGAVRNVHREDFLGLVCAGVLLVLLYVAPKVDVLCRKG